MNRRGLKPGFSLGMDLPGKEYEYRQVFPFRVPVIALLIVAVLDIAFLWPAWLTIGQAAQAWQGMSGLFELVVAVFLTAWLMGWCLVPLVLSMILLVMLFGRETLAVSRSNHVGELRLFVGLPLLGMSAVYQLQKMRNLRFVEPPPKSSHSWRGPHLVFDYGANPVAFGSRLEADDEERFRRRIEAAGGQRIATGPAEPEDLQGEWTESRFFGAAPTQDPARLKPASVAPLTAGSVSVWLLLLANAVPLAGAALLGWDLGHVMVLYWAESAVIGFWNIVKIIVIGRWAALLAAPFFAGHFGGFMAVHFLFVYTFFVQGVNDSQGSDSLDGVGQLFTDLWPALLLLFISHGYSFISNFVRRGEYLHHTVKQQMSEPYSRIIFMHLVLIFGGGLTLVLGQTVPVLVAIIVLKVVVDVRAHLKEHAVA